MEVYRHVSKRLFELDNRFDRNDCIGGYLTWVALRGWKIVSVCCAAERTYHPADVWHFIFAGTSDMEDPESPWYEKER